MRMRTSPSQTTTARITGTDVSDDEGDGRAHHQDDEDEDSDDSLPDLVHVDGDDIPGIDSQGNIKKTH